ncbi:hypothetical protein FKM82_014352 [Ascaphus truei]
MPAPLTLSVVGVTMLGRCYRPLSLFFFLSLAPLSPPPQVSKQPVSKPTLPSTEHTEIRRLKTTDANKTQGLHLDMHAKEEGRTPHHPGKVEGSQDPTQLKKEKWLVKHP